MTFQEIQQWNLATIGQWPWLAQLAVIIINVLLIFIIGYQLDYQQQLELWDSGQQQEEKLRKAFIKLQSKATNLVNYRQQVAQLNQYLATLQDQLPAKAEVASLLVDISQTGLALGLEFELFRPGHVIKKYFYELPIQIRAIGRYPQLGQFISQLAKLPRIVTLHDITLLPHGTGLPTDKRGPLLVMDTIAKIYHVHDETP